MFVQRNSVWLWGHTCDFHCCGRAKHDSLPSRRVFINSVSDSRRALLANFPGHIVRVQNDSARRTAGLRKRSRERLFFFFWWGRNRKGRRFSGDIRRHGNGFVIFAFFIRKSLKIASWDVYTRRIGVPERTSHERKVYDLKTLRNSFSRSWRSAVRDAERERCQSYSKIATALLLNGLTKRLVGRQTCFTEKSRHRAAATSK